MSPDNKLLALVGEHFKASSPAANYANATRWKDLIFLSGKSVRGPVNGKDPKGKLGIDFTTAEGAAFARQVGLELLVVLRDELGTLNKVQKVLELQGFVNASIDFEEHAKVLDGASDVIVEVLGDVGVHSRSVFGAVSLRENHPVILRATVGIADDEY
jgi:enamine deaminase RidA (YjgF/YER057c/UK114 family)